MGNQLPHRLIQTAQLESVRLSRLLAESSVKSKDDIAQPDLTIGYSSAPSRTSAHAGFWVNVRAEAVVKDKELSAPESAVRIVADFELKYELPEGFDIPEDELQAFADTNAVLNAWPYLREAIQSSSIRLGFPPIILPLYRLARPKQELTASATQKVAHKKATRKK